MVHGIGYTRYQLTVANLWQILRKAALYSDVWICKYSSRSLVSCWPFEMMHTNTTRDVYVFYFLYAFQRQSAAPIGSSVILYYRCRYTQTYTFVSARIMRFIITSITFKIQIYIIFTNIRSIYWNGSVSTIATSSRNTIILYYWYISHGYLRLIALPIAIQCTM